MKPLFALLFSLLLSIPAAAAGPAVQPKTPTANYGKLPLGFEANQGQTDASVDYLAYGKGYTLYLRKGEALLALAPSARKAAQQEYLQIRLVGANAHATAGAEEQQITRTNYFLGSNPAKWHTDIANYSRVRYRSVYRGIDLLYYGNQQALEHDFIVAPNADPQQIVLSFGGEHSLTRMKIDEASGDLVLADGKGSELRLLKPVTYQESHGQHQLIASHYKLLPDHRLRFALGDYDRSQPLIIDPILTYSTLLNGGSPGDAGHAIALDAGGNVYIAGKAASDTFPVTPGAFQNMNKTSEISWTGFVSKLNSTGTALLYSTYLGGSNTDYANGIAVDTDGNAYVTGITYSNDFPVTCNAFQAAYPSKIGQSSAFVTKLNANGSALIYSTYLGGSGNLLGEYAQGIAINTAGNAYVIGTTYSPDFPTTDESFQPKFPSAFGPTSFVTELSTDGSSQVYSTFLGGNNADYGSAITIDSSGDAFVVGSTSSSNFPVTSGAFQRTLTGSLAAFVTELNPAGTAEIFSTLIGGNSNDYGNAIARDGSGNVYVAGTSLSNNFPLTAGVVESTDVETNSYFENSSGSGFVTKLKPDGSELIYSTLVEGANTALNTVAVDAQGNAYVAGTTQDISYGTFGGFVPSTSALNISTAAIAFLVKLDPSAETFSFASLFGSADNDSITAIAVDKKETAYITGIASALDFPTTPGAFQTQPSQGSFVSAFALAGVADGSKYGSPINPIATSITGSASETVLSCVTSDPSEDALSIGLNITLAAASADGPTPSGTLTITDDLNYYGEFPDTQIVD